MKKTLLKLLLLVSLVFLPVGTHAALLDFSLLAPQPSTASVTYAGGASALVGSNIVVADVVGMGTSLNDGIKLSITEGLLNFATGTFSSFNSGTYSATWEFNTGDKSYIELWGKIPTLGINDMTRLLWGTGSISGVVTMLGGEFSVAILAFTDEKNETLKNFYGILAQYFTGNLNLSFYADVNPTNNSFASTTVLSGDMTNKVPIPAAAWLLATGLIGLVGVRRRWIKS